MGRWKSDTEMDPKEAEWEVAAGWINLAYVRISGRLYEHRKEFQCSIKGKELLD
jgi:hypothetical protein